MTHAAVPIAMALGLGRSRIPPVLVGLGIGAAMLPDLDVLSFQFGIPYEHALGHRGASHSLALSLVFALVCAAAIRGAVGARTAFLYLFASMASHGVLDMLTDGGHGVALLWPLSEERLFAPIRPVQVSPLGISRFFSAEGASVIASELVWIWLPCALLVLILRTVRHAPKAA